VKVYSKHVDSRRKGIPGLVTRLQEVMIGPVPLPHLAQSSTTKTSAKLASDLRAQKKMLVVPNYNNQRLLP